MAASGANQPSIGYGISSSDRQPSYAAAVSGSAPMNYAIQPPPIGSGGLSNLVQQSRLPPRHHARNPSQPQMQIHDPTGDHGSSVPASLSRSLGRESNPRPASNAAPFITPSFLQNSRYVEKLEVAFRAKTAAAHEMASSVSRSGIHALSRHPSSGSLPKPKMQPHRGVRHDIVEMEIEDEKDGLEPLPSKWSETDKCPGLELLADGLEVKLSQTPKPDEHRAAMVRADHPMPAQCGIYYYEVTILPRLQKDR